MTKAPWSDEIVDALNWYQICGISHPYTCSCPTSPVLKVTKNGFVCDKCGRTQDWCMKDIVEFVIELKILKPKLHWMT